MTKSLRNFRVMLVKADVPEQTDMVESAFSEAFAGYDVQGTEEDLESIQAKIKSGEAECAFVMTGSVPIPIMWIICLSMMKIWRLRMVFCRTFIV